MTPSIPAYYEKHKKLFTYFDCKAWKDRQIACSMKMTVLVVRLFQTDIYNHERNTHGSRCIQM